MFSRLRFRVCVFAFAFSLGETFSLLRATFSLCKTVFEFARHLTLPARFFVGKGVIVFAPFRGSKMPNSFLFSENVNEGGNPCMYPLHIQITM